MSNYVVLGEVVGSSGDSYEVQWEEDAGHVWCKRYGWGYGGTCIGKARSPREAMQKAEAWAVKN